MMMPLSERTLLQHMSVLPRFIGGTLRLNRGYSGPILQVFNGTTTRDVGSVNEIPAFCGSANGTVAVLYDQSSNGRNFIQATTTRQPKIYDGATTSLLRTNPRGPIVMRFDGVDDALARTDSCGLSGDVSVGIWHLAKVNSGTSGTFCHFGTNVANANLDMTFVTNLGGTTGANMLRSGTNTTGNGHWDDGVSGALSYAFHYVIWGRAAGALISQQVAEINGTTYTTQLEVIDGVGPSFNNLGAELGVRADGGAKLTGDIALLGLWTPQLTAADKVVLRKFSENWRIQ